MNASSEFVAPENIQRLWIKLKGQKELPPAPGFCYEELTFPDGYRMGYQFFTPSADVALPLVVYMAGTHHNNNESNDLQIRCVACHTFASLDFPFPCFVLAPWIDTPGHMPNTEEGRRTNLQYSARLNALIRNFIDNHSVDLSRVYFIGVGGGGQYQHVAPGADLYAAIAMNTSVFDYFADGQENEYLLKVSHIPIFLSHGVCDKPNPVRRSRYAYSLLQAAGCPQLVYREYSEAELIAAGADLDTFDGAHNTACTLPFLSEDLYRFLFTKHRNAAQSS